MYTKQYESEKHYHNSSLILRFPITVMQLVTETQKSFNLCYKVNIFTSTWIDRRVNKNMLNFLPTIHILISLKLKHNKNVTTQKWSSKTVKDQMDRVKRIWYLSSMRAAKIQHTCDQTRYRRDLPILGPQIRVTPDRPKLPIYMNSDFSLFPKAKTCFPITADACFI